MQRRLIIVGAGEAGRMLAAEIAASGESVWKLVGFLDDDPALGGAMVSGVPVLGPCDALAEAVAAVRADEVVIAVPSAGREFVRRMIALCRDAGVPIEIIRGSVRLEQIRDAHPEDLLGRQSVEFDERAIADALDGRTVLVTGAGGSIGSEICRQLARFPLERLVLLGRGENPIFEIENDLRLRSTTPAVESVICDIRDVDALTRHVCRIRPEFVYHAAAHKHVHYMEAHPDEAIKNNIVGTWNVVAAARACGVERLVMLSTDKAVSPRGVMGASKRVAEYLVRAASADGPTRCITVRFGNVLASRGSVVPLFIRQIRAGGPVTVSDERATRFFMSIREACMLVVQASIMGDGGEVFILRMGEPIRIVELARDLIALHGYRPDVDVPIRIVGLRPGEKLHEDLVAPGEVTEPSQHEAIVRAHAPLPDGFDAARVVRELGELAGRADGDAIRAYLARLIPDACFDAAGAPGRGTT